MALQPFFSLTASSPFTSTYDPATPSAAYATGYLYSYGGHTRAFSPYRLGDQSTNDEIILGFSPVDPTDQNIESMIDDIYRRCTIRASFAGYNVTTANQYLLLFALRRLSLFASVSAQFFVGANLVHMEEFTGVGDQQVAILFDTPGSGIYTDIYVRLASLDFDANMGFQGMDCYLL